MSGKRRQPRRRPQPAQPASAPRAAVASLAWPAPLRLAAGCLMALLVTFLGLGFSPSAGLVLVPAAAGLLLALVFTDWRVAGATAAGGALAGALLAWALFSPDAYAAALQHMPAYANPDVLQRLLYGEVIARVVRSGPFAVVPAAVVLAGAPLIAGVCAALPRRFAVLATPRAANLAGWAVTALAVVTLVVTVWQATPVFRQSLATAPADGAYAYDAHIYLRTYWEMDRGDGYYRALVRAASGDKRLQQEGAVKDGLFVGWASSPTLIREPAAFYLWRLAAPGGAGGILALSVVACAAVLGLWYWAGQRFAGPAAAFLPWVLWPYLLFAGSWHNIFFPDWWMALALLISVAFWVRGLFLPAVVAALAAALFREVAVFWLLALGVVAVVRLVCERAPDVRRGARISFAGAAAGLLVFAGLYWLHLRAGSAVIAPDIAAPVSFLGRLKASAAIPLTGRFLAPAEYMMFPYARFGLPGVVFLLVAPVAWWVAQRRGSRPMDRLTAAVVPAYLGFWLIFTLVIGAASSYWGQGYMPLALAGVALALAAVSGERVRSRSGTR